MAYSIFNNVKVGGISFIVLTAIDKIKNSARTN